MSHTKEGFLWTPSHTHSGLQTDSIQPSTPTIKPNYDIIVIGAGFAGLIAARDLTQKHNLNVLLIEARDRIGGRTWTAKVLDEELEMGGTWVHWAQPHVYNELQRYGLHRYLKTSAGTLAPEKQFFKSSRGEIEEVPIVDSVQVLERIADVFFSIDGLDSRALMPYPHDPLREPALWKRYDHLTAQDRLDQLSDKISQRHRELFQSNISTFGSALGKDMGFVEALRWYALGGHSMARVFEMAGIYKIGNGGMTAFARAVLGEYTGDRLFNTTVRGINHIGRNKVVVNTSNGEFNAKAVVSTIPLNCLDEITFNPPLSPLRQAALAKKHINNGTKVHFKLSTTQKPWFATADGTNNNSDFVFAFSDHNGTKQSPSGTWCIGFGYNGRLPDKNDDRHIINRFQQDINPDADVEAYVTHDWKNDPYSKGAWACWGSNSASMYLEELQRAHGRVVFASADWADGWRGFVDGAIERGQSAVREAANLLDGDDGVARL